MRARAASARTNDADGHGCLDVVRARVVLDELKERVRASRASAYGCLALLRGLVHRRAPLEARCSRCCCVERLEGHSREILAEVGEPLPHDLGWHKVDLIEHKNDALGGVKRQRKCLNGWARHASGSRASSTMRRISAFSISTLMCL